MQLPIFRQCPVPKIKNPKTKLIQPIRGELPVGGEFQVEYEYTINFNEETKAQGIDPADAGKVQPVTNLAGEAVGTLKTGAEVIERTKVDTQVRYDKEIAIVHKVETFKVKERAASALNYEIIVKDPVNGLTDMMRSKSSSSTPKDSRGRSRPEYIPVNHRLPRKE
ncbi:MAG: hypothetical protein KIT57_23365 [Blastocatellales bacterium]|nr:hypothetical protein [Blastocatellales bacterium]